MKILWICGSRIVGGAERVTIQIAAQLRDRGHTLEVICPPRSALNAPLEQAHLESKAARLGGSLNVIAALDISRALARAQPDIALVTTSDEWVWASIVRRPARTRLVLVRHMSIPLPLNVRIIAGLRAGAIIAVSEAVRQSLIGTRAIRPALIEVIHNPVRFAPRGNPPALEERRAARAALAIPRAHRWIGFFGGLDEKKGIGDLVAAACEIANRIGPVSLLICGRPGSKNARPLDEWARMLGAAGAFHYLGETQRVQEAMTAADVVAVPTHSSLKEGLPLTPLEAMACGTPVVGYATGGTPEAIGPDGDAGLLADSDDPRSLAARLGDVLSNPALAQRLAAGGLRRVRQHFTPELAADRYETLFRNLLAGRRA